MKNTQPYIGQSISRVDGKAKVTGNAKYAGEFNVPDLLYGYIVNSTITKGKILKIDIDAVLALPGVVHVLTHENRPSTAWLDFKYADMDAPQGSPFRPLHDDEIKYNGQPIALVIAESFEMARYAASLLDIQYEEEKFVTNLEQSLGQARKPKMGIQNFLKPPPPKPKGNVKDAYDVAAAKTTGTFVHGIEHHNPMEMFASTVQYEGEGKLIIYDKTQGVVNSQMYVANVFGLHFKNVRVISPFVGGGFGAGLRPQYQLFLAVMASLELKRSVRVTMDRHQMFTFGHRPATVQHLKFGADKTGKMTAIFHEAIGETSRYEDYGETVVNWANMLYPCENVLLDYKLVSMDMATPMDMRAPGGATGLHPIEVAMDELSYQLNIDPVEFRLINYSMMDDSSQKPYSSKELKACFLQGAEKFGWANRNPEPRSMRDGHQLKGMGVATGMWDCMQMPARAEAELLPGGRLKVSSATSDIGTGTYTIMTQIAADMMGMNMDDVTFLLGDTDMPLAPIQGGSFTAATIGTAVQVACEGLKKKIFKKAKAMKNSSLAHLDYEKVVFKQGNIQSLEDSEIYISLKDVLVANKGKSFKSRNTGLPAIMKQRKFTRSVHSAVFAEVEVDEDLGFVTVTKLVTAVAAGKIINPKTARSQILGGMVWGISKALHEETVMDHRYGRAMNRNLSEYYMPVNADVHNLEVIFVEEGDNVVNDLGIKGVGEIGLIGVAPAIANAIFHATGKRIHNLPIKLDMLL